MILCFQERGGSSSFTHEALTLKYKLDNEFELVFVVSYRIFSFVVVYYYYELFIFSVKSKNRTETVVTVGVIFIFNLTSLILTDILQL